jgi:CRP-like cAMP-binding protein
MEPTPEGVKTAVGELLDAKGDELRMARIALLDAVADHPDPRWGALVLKVAIDAGADVEIADHAARAMTHLTDPRFIPWLIPRLRVREGRSTVREALVHQGEPALDAVAAALLDPTTDADVRLHIPRTISRFSSQRAADLLLEVLVGDPQGSVRYKALRGLGHLVTDTTLLVDRVRVEPEVRTNLIEALRITALQVALGKLEGGTTSGPLLLGLLEDKRKQAIERAFRFLQIVHRHEDIQAVYSAIVGHEKARRAQALEFLDALTVVTGRDRRLDGSIVATRDDIRELVLLFGDDFPPASRVARAVRFIGKASRSRDEALALLAREPDKTVANVAAFYAAELATPSQRPRLHLPSVSPESEALATIRTSAPSLPARVGRARPRELDKDNEIARHLFLQQLMGPTPGSVVSRLAHQMTGRTFAPGAVVYEALTPSTSIFFIKSGEVELQHPGEKSRVFTAPAVVGGFDALSGRPHIRRLIAVAEVEAFVLEREDWLDALEDQFEFARQFMILLCQTLGKTILSKPPDGAFSLPAEAGAATHDLNFVERLLLLGSVTMFEAATIQSIAQVAQIATEARYAAGDTIQTEGAATDGVLVVVSGQVEVTHTEPAIFGRMGPGQLVGGPASLGAKEHLFAAKAIAPAVLLSVLYGALFDIMEDHFDLTFSALSALGNDIERSLSSPSTGSSREVRDRPASVESVGTPI